MKILMSLIISALAFSAVAQTHLDVQTTLQKQEKFVNDAGEVRTIKQQLRANVWCIDPTGRTWFELRNLLRSIS